MLLIDKNNKILAFSFNIRMFIQNTFVYICRCLIYYKTQFFNIIHRIKGALTNIFMP